MIRTPQSDSRAVTPVIGIVLMVAITVILAAVIGVFGLGFGQDVSSPSPQSGVTLEVNSGAGESAPSVVRVKLEGGDALNADRTRVSITYGSTEWVMDPASTDDHPLTPGDTAVIEIDDNAGTLSVSSTVWSDYNSVSNGDSEFGSEEVTVEIIDTQTEKVVYKASASA